MRDFSDVGFLLAKLVKIGHSVSPFHIKGQSLPFFEDVSLPVPSQKRNEMSRWRLQRSGNST